jgi:carbamoyltransferase
MNYIGISAGFHDAALSVVNNCGEILFAGHSERYSKHKHDRDVCHAIMKDALNYIDSDKFSLHYYERPWLKFLRQLRAGEPVHLGNLWARNIIGKEHLKHYPGKLHTHNHHLSHAAAGFQTSPFDRATVVVIDAIGEFDTATIWAAEYKEGRATYRKLWSQTYPDSIGLYYSAMTQRVGLRPLDEEYILMGMAGWGEPHLYNQMRDELIEDIGELTFKNNLHTGVSSDFLSSADHMDIASSSQKLVETLIYGVMARAREFDYSNNLVYMGGVALNCLANRNLGKYFDRVWIMPNPGDAGSSLGAAALGYGGHLNWCNAFLGHEIPGAYPVEAAVNVLLTDRIVGVASGRAEFGPRALGNRSLLADPRGPEIKDQVNSIKRRQKFRPFAPVILEEHVHQYFDMPRGWVDSRYMQIVAPCRFPDQFPAIVHVDGTSRVQSVPRDGTGIRQLLESWYQRTGCPMLLNTSLNIRGEPMVNDRADADRFETLYGVRVVS